MHSAEREPPGRASDRPEERRRTAGWGCRYYALTGLGRTTTTVEPYRIELPPPLLDDLRERLGRTRWPNAVDGAGWDYGTNSGYLRDLVDYWGDGYDWRAGEANLNEFEQYRAEIDGTGVHFVHEHG